MKQSSQENNGLRIPCMDSSPNNPMMDYVSCMDFRPNNTKIDYVHGLTNACGTEINVVCLADMMELITGDDGVHSVGKSINTPIMDRVMILCV